MLNKLKLLNGRFVVYTDSQGAFHIYKNLIYHYRTKYIRVNYHFIKFNVLNDSVQIEKLPTEKNLTVMDTKIISVRKLVFCRNFLHISQT